MAKAKVVALKSGREVKHPEVVREDHRKAAVSALKALVKGIEEDNLSLKGFLLLAELETPVGKKRFMFADGGQGVSPDLYTFLESVRINIQGAFHESYFGSPEDIEMERLGEDTDNDEETED